MHKNKFPWGMTMLPSWQRFSGWSLPNRATYISFLLAIASIALTVVLAVLPGPSPTQVVEFDPPVPSKSTNGECWTNSLVNARANAWRCDASGNDDIESGIYDPCFEKLRFDESNSPTIICGAKPGDDGKTAFLLQLIRPLPRPEYKRSMLGKEGAESAWVVELSDGTFCELMSGASITILNNRLNYLCDSQKIPAVETWLVGYPRLGDDWAIQAIDLNTERLEVVGDRIEQIKTVYR